MWLAMAMAVMVLETRHRMMADGEAINAGRLGTPVQQQRSRARQAYSTGPRVIGTTVGGKANRGDRLRIAGRVIMIGSSTGQAISGNHMQELINKHGAACPSRRCSKRQARAGPPFSLRQ